MDLGQVRCCSRKVLADLLVEKGKFRPWFARSDKYGTDSGLNEVRMYRILSTHG